jgi:hypothetical protein
MANTVNLFVVRYFLPSRYDIDCSSVCSFVRSSIGRSVVGIGNERDSFVVRASGTADFGIFPLFCFGLIPVCEFALLM